MNYKIILLLIFLVGCTNQVCFENNCFDVEIADSPEERARGLMFREFLEPNEGMLFVYTDDDIRAFWMKNTIISLDIIWINKNEEVVFISKETPPCVEEPCPVYNPEVISRYVLEVNSGVVDEIGLGIGDEVRIDQKIIK